MLSRCVLVLGPTASGKSALALRLAVEHRGEILNADSRQVYRRLSLGTAKPSAQSQALVPHHLYDLVDPEEPFSVEAFRRAALARALEVTGRGKLPFVVGGTGLYLRALLTGLSPVPARSRELHARLAAVADRGGLVRLRRWLERVDPALAARIGAGDRNRTLRGLDVYLQSGVPLSAWLERRPRDPFPFQVCKIGLELERTELNRRLDERVEAMMTEGLLEEVRELLRRPGFLASNAATALGYRALAEHLLGKRSLGSAVEEMKRDSRRFAKRQMTWFRREACVQWIPAADPAVALERARACLEGWLRAARQADAVA